MIERQIVIGLIVSTEYLQHIRPDWDTKLLESKTAQLLATWCVEYFDKYNKAPGETIETIYFEKLREGRISKDEGEDIEDILADLSDEYEAKFNLQYLLDQGGKYLKERRLERLIEKAKEAIESGELDTAEGIITSYNGVRGGETNDLDLSNVKVLLDIENAFTELAEPIFTYPGVFGQFINRQLTRGSFVAFMASEKRGKSWWMLDMAMRANRQKCKVAFFQAGDMTQNQQLKRICSYLTKKPAEEIQSNEIYIPILDCMYNQLDECSKVERECDHGIFTDTKYEEENIKKEITSSKLKDALENSPDYLPCHNCLEYKKKSFGVPYFKKTKVKGPVTVNEAKRKVEEFFIKHKRRFKISTHANSTLSVDKIKVILEQWERDDGFVPDLIVIDYADLLITDKSKEFRHQQNQIWKELRALNQEKNCLLVTATQADARSYEMNTLSLSNFSEDKRKYAHCTAMYGLNQDKDKREKKMGLLRINELVKREGGEGDTSIVTVLQQLDIGRPFLGSFL